MPAPPLQLAAAYAVCRGITRTNARNFYYAFLVLPRAKRDALAAVYAFMRQADDLSDDPTLPSEEKATKLAAWRDELHRVLAGGATDDPVLFALADAQRHFAIPPDLLDQLITGTTMDISATPVRVDAGDSPALLYETFDDLRRYCYYVASVVGLVTIRIFGYTDAAAEPLAEDTGVAFQLTNIIRDVKEDAEMGRIYLPADDLARHGRGAADLAPAALRNGFDAARLRPVLELQAERARQLYCSAERLLPYISADSRPALWALVEIYRRLLERIAERNFEVFDEKIRLSSREKALLLLRGLWLRLTQSNPPRTLTRAA
jgi:phytoene synthase